MKTFIAKYKLSLDSYYSERGSAETRHLQNAQIRRSRDWHHFTITSLALFLSGLNLAMVVTLIDVIPTVVPKVKPHYANYTHKDMNSIQKLDVL